MSEVKQELLVKNPTGDLIKDCMLEIIFILKQSCTQCSEAAGYDEHEHNLFDDIDMKHFELLEKVIRSD